MSNKSPPINAFDMNSIVFKPVHAIAAALTYVGLVWPFILLTKYFKPSCFWKPSGSSSNIERISIFSSEVKFWKFEESSPIKSSVVWLGFINSTPKDRSAMSLTTFSLFPKSVK